MILFKNKGITLIELLIVIVISSLLVSALYWTYIKQQKTYIIQDQIVDMQQNIRAAMDIMARYIRMAGYDPQKKGIFGFQISASDGRSTGPNSIAFTVDYNENGEIDNDDNEQIAFRLNGRTLEKYSPSDNNHWQALADNIESLKFIYTLADGTETTSPITPSEIRMVNVKVVTTASEYENLRRELASYIKVRNLGL